MKQSKRKKKRSRPQNQDGVIKGAVHDKESEKSRGLKSLMEAFTSVSIEEADSAYIEADGDLNKAAEILGVLEECSSSGGSARLSSSLGSSSTEGFLEASCGRKGREVGGGKQKKVIAATGTVSNVLGKEYVMASPRKGKCRNEGFVDEPLSKGDAEQFLCSMLGDDCDLSLAVVRDVLGQCRYDVEKAMNALLELSASSYEQSKNDQSCEGMVNNKEDTQFLFECSDDLTERASDSTSHTSESEIQDNMWPQGFRGRNYFEVLTCSQAHSLTGPRSSKSELPQKVLESLFNMPKSAEHEPNAMNWRDVVKKMESLGQRIESDLADAAGSENIHGEGNEYQVFRKAAGQHWDSMKSYYQKAATAFSNGEREHAAYLSEQGRVYNKMAREADEKASQEIFKARNKSIENVITIDLHGQHVKQALRLLKVHLLFGAYVRSVQIFRVITGCGRHGVGKSKLKQSVLDLVKREGIEWSEENRGTILIKLDGQREFSFLELESDSD
ncbi:hypothetical protein RHMOL_Rhmol01G0320900 [Rhododendron molle]|uniref:Uncharacterized protein n=1 Tax=Rhododendron molle TaxID=49168 RepID=A0ACC0QB96_RHOML|nr:hypothetical protein RHMOL_Rhmol01G0320900 [Rhododendron molle]